MDHQGGRRKDVFNHSWQLLSPVFFLVRAQVTPSNLQDASWLLLCNSWFALMVASSVQFSHSVRSDSLQPHGLQHARLPCPSPTPGACSHTCPIELVMPSSHLIFWPALHPLPSILPSIRVLSNESILRTGWWPVLFKWSLIWAYWNQPPALILLMPFIPTHFFFFFCYSSWSLLWSWKVLDLSGPPEVALLCWLFLSTLFCLPKVYTLPGIHTGSRLWWGSSFSRRQAVLPVTLTAATMSPRGLPWHTPVPDAFLFLLQSWHLPFGSPTQLLFPAWWVKFSATFPGQRRATCSDFGLSLPFLGHQLHSFFIYSVDSSVNFSRGRHVVTYSEIHHYYFTVIKTLWM